MRDQAKGSIFLPARRVFRGPGVVTVSTSRSWSRCLRPQLFRDADRPCAVNSDIGDDAAGRRYPAKQKVSGTPTASMRINARPAVRISPFRLHFLCLLMMAVAPKARATLEAIVVEGDHDDLRRRIELRRQQRRESDGPETTMATSIGRRFAGQHAAFEPVGRMSLR